MSQPSVPIDGGGSVTARVRSVIDDCRRRRIGGEVLSDEAVIAAHPELMPELGDELDKLRLIAAARERAAQPIGTEVATISRHDLDTGTGTGHLEVRCPSCHAPMEVAVDTLLTDLNCSACGSHFSLVDQSKTTGVAPSLSKVGRFELIERIGIGAYGSVWKARDKELDRTVAIKIPRAGGMPPAEQEKFFREARAAAQLRHPNIVSVHEVGRDGDNVYIVSDFVRGVTLGDWLTGQQLTGRESAELCAKIAGALHHAHEQGIVHRDLKPANIMMDYDGQPHLMDFGLARREIGEVTVTIDGQVLGTPAYMSPEQARGEAHTADCRSDVYSLGVILFQLLTGELPFRGNARMLIKQVIDDEPPSPRKLNGNVPKDLETITLKCLEKDPRRRYTNAQEVSDELRRQLTGQPILARPCTMIGSIWRWYQRNTMAVVVTAGGYMTILSIIFIIWGAMGLFTAFGSAVPASNRMVWELMALLTIGYPPMLIAGVSTVKGRLVGLVGGTVLITCWTVATLLAALKVNLGILQLEVMSAARVDPFFHFQLAVLLLLLTGIGMVLYFAAFIATVRAELQRRLDRRRPAQSA